MKKEEAGVLDFFTLHKSLIEKRLEELIPSKKSPFSSLYDGARYSLLAKSKRIRPLLCMAAVEILEGPLEQSLDPSCALELLHTYSLIHDDLPSMDDDDFRRGIPTLHKVTSEGHAILVGDYLLTYTFDVIARSPFPSAIQLELIKSLCAAAGGEGMVGGQVMDLAMTGKKIPLNDLEFLHSHKTGALIKTSLLFGAIMAGASSTEREILASFGEKLGLLFQIVDDILDVTKPKQKHGTAISGDAAKAKATYVSLLGLDCAHEKAKMLFLSLSDILNQLPRDTFLLKEIATNILSQIET